MACWVFQKTFSIVVLLSMNPYVVVKFMKLILMKNTIIGADILEGIIKWITEMSLDL